MGPQLTWNEVIRRVAVVAKRLEVANANRVQAEYRAKRTGGRGTGQSKVRR